jgi:hypothetical protein
MHAVAQRLGGGQYSCTGRGASLSGLTRVLNDQYRRRIRVVIARADQRPICWVPTVRLGGGLDRTEISATHALTPQARTCRGLALDAAKSLFAYRAAAPPAPERSHQSQGPAKVVTFRDLLDAAFESHGVLELHGELRCGDRVWARR